MVRGRRGDGMRTRAVTLNARSARIHIELIVLEQLSRKVGSVAPSQQSPGQEATKRAAVDATCMAHA